MEVFTKFNVISTAVPLREGFKKKKKSGKVHEGGGGAAPDFPLKKQTKKNMGLKHWILHKDPYKTHLFFSIFGWGTLLSLDLGSKGVSNL